MEDLDLEVDIPDEGCNVNHDNVYCPVAHDGDPESAFVTLEVDAADFGHFGGETLFFEGAFPPTHVVTIYVENISL